MTTFKKAVIAIAFFYIIITNLFCNEISYGDKRRKFEFLYRMSNHMAFLTEYTGSLTYFNDLDFYAGRMKILRDEIEKIDTISGWKVSYELKEEFLNTLDFNIGKSEELKNYKLEEKAQIKNKLEYMLIEEKVIQLKEYLEKEIVNVGKE